MTAPRDDLIAHEHEDCVCGPLQIPVVTGTGVRTQIGIHRRLDGRENEPAADRSYRFGQYE